MNQIQQRLSNMIERGRLHHAFFFVGSGAQTHLHKKDAISFLASRVFALSSDMPLEKIEQRIAKHYHPDFYAIQTDEGEIKVDQIQELIAWIYRAPVESQQKVAVIEHAQRLNPSASNALLKTLEEPPSHATLILCAPSKDHLLQTLQSRMSILQFPQSFDSREESTEQPAWLEKIQNLVMQETFIEKDVFDTTQEMSKNRSELALFFAWIEPYLTGKIANAASAFDFNLYSELFDQALRLEQQIYKRYGNVALQLDQFFMDWKRRAH